MIDHDYLEDAALESVHQFAEILVETARRWCA
jgi:hypothetical protein